MPFMYSKTKINLRLTIKDKYDKKKQIRALMPNLIHSLDGGSLSLLYNKFNKFYNNNAQFYSVHDCFGTTMDKVDNLKTLLASVYTDIYSKDIYLDKFDKCILDNIENSTHDIFNRKDRTVKLTNTKLKDSLYVIHDIE
jgi:DNA-directed RNA polymerase